MVTLQLYNNYFFGRICMNWLQRLVSIFFLITNVYSPCMQAMQEPSANDYIQKINDTKMEDTDWAKAISEARHNAGLGSFSFKSAQTRLIGLELFKLLVKNNNGLDDATEAAYQEFLLSDEKGLPSALELFNALFEKNTGFDQALKAANNAISDVNKTNRRIFGYKLFQALVQKDKYLTEATKAASEPEFNADVLNSILELFKTLFAKDTGFNQAFQAAQDAIGDYRFPDKRLFAIQLFQVLVQNNKYLIQVAETIQKRAEYADAKEADLILDIFKMLFAKNEGFDQALKAAETTSISYNNPDHRRLFSLTLFTLLVDNGYKKSFDKATDAAQQATSDYHKKDRQILGFKLFEALVKQKQSYNKAIEAAKTWIKSSDTQVQQATQDLASALKDKGQSLTYLSLDAEKIMEDVDALVKTFDEAQKQLADDIQQIGKDLLAEYSTTTLSADVLLQKYEKKYEEMKTKIDEFKENTYQKTKDTLNDKRKTLVQLFENSKASHADIIIFDSKTGKLENKKMALDGIFTNERQSSRDLIQSKKRGETRQQEQDERRRAQEEEQKAQDAAKEERRVREGERRRKQQEQEERDQAEEEARRKQAEAAADQWPTDETGIEPLKNSLGSLKQKLKDLSTALEL